MTNTLLEEAQTPLRVLITGAAGQVAYSLFQSLANGDVFGPKQQVSLVLLETETNVERLNGVVMELIDSALPLLIEAVPTADIVHAFTGIDVAVLVGAKPRKNGMNRKDLLETNVRIFKEQGEALDRYAKKTVKVVVVGNPANTNTYICQQYANSIPKENFSCLTRLDQNRAQAQIARRLTVNVQSVKNVIVWGSHSSTQFADASHATVTIGSTEMKVSEAINDDDWLENDFITSVQHRGTEVIAARKLSSAMSAAKAIRDHLRDWWHGTEPGRWVSMGVVSDGSYGIEAGLFYSFPVTIEPDRTFTIVHGLVLDNFAKSKMAASMLELIDEKDAAMEVFQIW